MVCRREEHAGEIVESKNMASLLLMLSCGTGRIIRKTATVGGRLFECKTCNRRFPTFQALGGHRTSHRRIRVGGAQKIIKRVHKCSICGLEFPLGQALGGHMRRHKPATANGGTGFSLQEQLNIFEKKDRVKKLLRLDLNLPPLDGEMEELPLIDFFGQCDS